jgi:hypothetical protein
VAALLEERARATGRDQLDTLATAVAERTVDPWTAAGRLLDGT